MLKWILICLFSLILTTNARPEAALPYYYAAPSIDQNSLTKTRTFASSSGQTFGHSATANQNFGQSAAALSQNYLPTNYNTGILSNSYGTPILRTTTSNIGQVQASAVLPNRNYGSPDLVYSNQSPISAYRSQPEPSVSIQKHIYVHVAPPDPEEVQRQSVLQSTRQKHYKIIFVKVPSYPTQAQITAQQQAQSEEKTLVYVLVKKPEDPLEVRANQIANTPVNRPEVYFIKYKAKSEHTSSSATGGGQNTQNQVQHTESLHHNPLENNDDSVVIESAFKGAANSLNQGGYNYDRPGGILK